MLAQPSQIIGGLGPPWPPSSYAYDLNPKKKCLCVCVCVWGRGGERCCVWGGEVLETKLFFRRGDQGQQLKEV